MSNLRGLLSPDRVHLDLKAGCKREALSQLAGLGAVETGLEQEDIFDTLMERERLGSTGVGNGVAIPHGKLAGLEEMVGILVRLNKPLDYDAVDGQPVDLVFMLLAPAAADASHLKTLSKVARVMRDAKVRDAMRGVTSAEGLFAIAIEKEDDLAA